MNAVIKTPSLGIYLKELDKFPLLSIDEEITLLNKYNRDNCEDSAYKIITSNLRFAASMALQYAHKYKYGKIDTLDLIQAGNIGLMKALKKFKPSKKCKFISYAVHWIRSELQIFIRRNVSIVSSSTRKIRERLFYKTNENNKVKLEADMNYDDHHKNTIGTTDEDIINYIEKEELRIILNEELRDISDKDKFVITNRLMADVPMTLQEIADNFGISREGARQLELRIKNRLKNKFENNKQLAEWMTNE